MKTILSIGHLDIRLFLRDKAAYIWLFAVPIAFMYLFGFMHPAPREPSNPKPEVLIENLDTGDLGAALVAALGEQGITALDQSRRDDAARGIRIPEDFSSKIRAKERVDIEFFTAAESGEALEAMVELRLIRALIALNTHLFQFGVEGGDFSSLTEAALVERFAQKGPVALSVVFGTRKPIPYGFDHTMPGILIMFILMNLLIFGASSVSQERANGVIRRLASYPVSRAEIVTGKIYGRFLLAVAQIAVLILFGELVLGVTASNHLGALLLVLFLFAWMSSSLGVLIGSFVTSPELTYGVCVGGTLIMAALGGCWWPIEVVPEGLQSFGHLFPTAWAMDALHQLITFGGSFANIATETLILAAFALVAHLGALFSLRYE